MGTISMKLLIVCSRELSSYLEEACVVGYDLLAVISKLSANTFLVHRWLTSWYMRNFGV